MELSLMVHHHQQHHLEQQHLLVRFILITPDKRSFGFVCLAVGQANTEWYLNPVPREVKDQVKQKK
jgi:hypothetical protein